MTQNVVTVGSSMQMVMDPSLANYGQYVPVPGYQTVQTTWQQSITTHTFTRLDPGNYTGSFDANGKRNGQGKCVWVDGSNYDGEWADCVRHGQGTFKSREGTVYEG